MPKFKNREEAHKVHEKYDIDTDREGKYSENDMYCVQKNRLRFILSGIHDDDHVLEVGCNSGGLLRLLSSRKKCYCNGIDISPEMVKRAQDKGFCAVLGAAESLPYPDNTFDSVVITEVLEHIYDPDEALREAWRVLKDGGLCVGSVPHPDSENSKRKTTDDHDWHCTIFKSKKLNALLHTHFDAVYLENIAWYNDQDNKPQWIGFICKKGIK